MKISIIIPTYNEECYIDELLDYINVHPELLNKTYSIGQGVRFSSLIYKSND